MEEFRKFCAGMAGAPEIVTKINNLSYTAADKSNYKGANCLDPMASDLEKLNE